MNIRVAVAAGSAVLVLVLGAAWWQFRPGAVTQAAEATDLATPDDGEPLPLPPVPPRIAEGADYDHCLSMLGTDPAGASSFAENWQANGGGDGAAHCRALAQIALGSPEVGAGMLEQLAAASSRPAFARASVYGQAEQAWMMAGEEDRAYAAGTQALALSADDPDLRIDHAVAAAALDRYGDAIADLDVALQLDPRRADALVLRAVAWRHLNHLDRATDDLDRAFSINPDNPEALLERGIERERQGNRAQADWARTIDLSPDSPTADLAQQNLALLEVGPDRR
jgi:tetratricopeptide (TPR) repeat protein